MVQSYEKGEEDVEMAVKKIPFLTFEFDSTDLRRWQNSAGAAYTKKGHGASKSRDYNVVGD